MSRRLEKGWYYIAAFFLLVILLLVMQREQLAPWAATGARWPPIRYSVKNLHRPHFKHADRRRHASGWLLAVLAGVGLIVGALSVTGLSGT